MPRRTLLLLTAALLTATLAGCADGTSSPATARGTAAADRRVPADPEQALHLAEQLLIKKCMEKQGYKYWVEEQPSKDGVSRFPYVVDDPAWAARHGYGTDLYRARQQEVRRDPNQRYFRSMPADRAPALVSALNGARPTGLSARLPGGMKVTHSDQGCASEAQRTLYEDLPAWFRATRITDSLGGMRVGMVLGDKRYRAAAKSWARCMKAEGYSYPGPAEARAAATRPDRPWPHAKEVRLASAEADCAGSTGLASVARSLDTEYRAELRSRYPGPTADLDRLKREALPRARSVITGG
ncbi:hypothetical protein [Streptomyces sp. SID13726]|uniref:hypothetical protein n=1 Tax=Streptomyces sp. SID13726 TaxID=2706058 RepID=UPI0013BE529A|nr:hypothetical protein [Streptomyces sp. SID13726]NEA97819.1 hypothetical protein [Streptomyces sp. SID13726]